MKLPELKVKVTKKYGKTIDYEIRASDDVYKLFKQLFDSDTILWKEEMIMLVLNQGGKAIGYYKVASGGMAGVTIDPKIIFTVVLNSGGNRFILAHNHPSGRLKPSKEDMKLTERIKKGAEILALQLLDHLILGDEGYYSMKDNGDLV